MPQLYRPETQVIKTKEIRTRTKQGECDIKISLDLNININADGITVKQAGAQVVHEEEGDKPDWTIGDFAPKKKVKFGKSVQE